MKTGNDSVNDVYSLLNLPALTSVITGNIYKYHKPLNSKKINVVINSLTLSNAPLQSGIVNVNIHAPNLPASEIDGVSDSNFPNSTLLNDLAKIAIHLLDTQWRETFHTDVDTSPNMLQDNDGTWYINIRVNYYSSITEFKNI